MQWTFAMLIVIIVLALGLGIFISNPTWLQPQIAHSTADGMSKTNEIEYQKGLLDLERAKQEVEMAAERAAYTLENQKILDQRYAEFLSSLFITVNQGVLVLFVAGGVTLIAWGFTASLKSYKLAMLQAETIYAATNLSERRQPSTAAMLARERERKQRHKRIFIQNTRPIWPDNDDPRLPSRDNLPWAN
jgi:hypothetical protein